MTNMLNKTNVCRVRNLGNRNAKKKITGELIFYFQTWQVFLCKSELKYGKTQREKSKQSLLMIIADQ